MAKGKKLDFKKVAVKTLTTAGTGVIAQIASDAITSSATTGTFKDNPEYLDYAMIAAGIILPEVVKGNDMVNDASDALIAVAGYKLSQHFDIAGKLGFGPKVTGVNDFRSIGATGGGWNPGRTYQASKVGKTGAPGNSEKATKTVM